MVKTLLLLFIITLHSFFQAGGCCSKCRQSVVIHPQPSPAQIRRPEQPMRIDPRRIVLQPIAASSLRKERIKRHVKFALRKTSSSSGEQFKNS